MKNAVPMTEKNPIQMIADAVFGMIISPYT